MKNVLLVLALVGLLNKASGQEKLSEEEVIFMEVKEVVSPSKRLQPITEAASSIEIITAEDIKNSGATNIGDVLRNVAGIDIRESDAGQHVIGIRGFADTGHVLVTLDGNNVFMYHANHIFLDWAPLDLEEIDHIEIIKGPGAVFYGGSAFSGVINIITKKPGQLDGTQVNIVGGNYDTVRTNIIHSGSYKDLDYSISEGYRGAKEWEPPKIPQERENFSVGYFSTKAIYQIGEGESISLMGRFSAAKNVISSVCQPKTTFLSLRYGREDTWLRLFYNHHQKTFWNDTYGVEDSNYELESYHSLRWGKNITSIGGYAKKTSWAVEGLQEGVEGKREAHDVKGYAINLENEHRFNNQLILTLGARGEYYSLLKYLGLSRGSIIYKPKENQNLRFTIASGYYIPSLFQHTNEGKVYPFALGNPSLKEEGITSYELSHYSLLKEGLKLTTSLFYNDYRGLIDNPSGTATPRNIADAKQYGGEAELDFILTNWLNGFFNYSYQYIKRDDFGTLQVDPRNKFNFGLKAYFDKWLLNLAFHYVDKYYEMYLTSNPVFGRVPSGPSMVDSYTTLDTQIAFCPYDNLELKIAAYNLFNNRHYESNKEGWHTGDKISRRITLGVSYNFK